MGEGSRFNIYAYIRVDVGRLLAFFNVNYFDLAKYDGI